MQTRRHSVFEAVANTLVGFAIAMMTNYYALPLFGFLPSIAQSFWITCIFTVVTLMRSYALRRLFNWLGEHDAARF